MRFGYLLAPATKFGELYLVDDFTRFANQVSQQELLELDACYQEILHRHDSEAISRWIDRSIIEREQISQKEFMFSQRVSQLFVLFDYLGDKGYVPFNSRQVRYEHAHYIFDWSKLPPELNYLINIAERIAQVCPSCDPATYLQQASPEDLAELSTLAQCIRQRSDSKLIYEWIKVYPFPQHQESWLIYCILGVLDEAGLQFE